MPKTAARAGELWKTQPDDHDFPAALDYLSLVIEPEAAARLVDALRGADTTHRKAKDLLRASRLAVLPLGNVHVQADLKKIKRRQPLSPVLLVRGNVLEADRPLQIADGYHRICASFYTDENADIPCRLVTA